MRRMALGLLVLLAGVGTASAVSVDYSTGDVLVTGLGNNGYPSPYDSLTITGWQQTSVDVTDSPQILSIGQATLDVGYSSYGEFSNTLTVTRDITVNGVTEEIVQLAHGFSLYAGDYMQLDEGAATVTFHLAGGATLDVTPLALGLPTSGGLGVGQSATGELYARFVDSPPPVPEPLTMVSAFLAISGLGAYLRKRAKAAA